MKRVYVNEKWCLACHLCEYYCTFANSGETNIVKALKNAKLQPRIRIEEKDNISFAVSCRHCEDALCAKSCIAGAISIVDGVVSVDKNKCVGCYTCIVSCPYGAIMPSEEGIIRKCELCTQNATEEPACVTACPNKAIVYEER